MYATNYIFWWSLSSLLMKYTIIWNLMNLIILSKEVHAIPVSVFEPKWCKTLFLKRDLIRNITSSLSISIEVTIPSSSSSKTLPKPTSSERKRVSSKDIMFFSSNLVRTTLRIFFFFFKSSSSFFLFSLLLVMRRLTTSELVLLFMLSVFLIIFKISKNCEKWKSDIPKVYWQSIFSRYLRYQKSNNAVPQINPVT